MARNKFKKGLPPGSVIYTGSNKGQTVEIHALAYNLNSIKKETFKSSDNRNLTSVEEGYVQWYDVRGLHDVEFIKKIGHSFSIHNLILEDIVEVFQRPKFEDFENGIFLTFKALEFNKISKRITSQQVSIFFNANTLISFQEYETDLLHTIQARIENSKGKLRAKGTDYLAFAIIDVLVDNYFETIESLDVHIQELESKLINNEDTKLKLAIHRIRREVLSFRAMVVPVREMINKFAKSESEFINEGTRVYLRDVQDHVSQVLDTSENYRDTLNGLHDLLMSNVSYKMNQVMKILTTISTIFIPLTFLAGVYGMNFDNMPELHWKYGYFILIGVFIVISLLMVWYFRRKKWF